MVLFAGKVLDRAGRCSQGTNRIIKNNTSVPEKNEHIENAFLKIFEQFKKKLTVICSKPFREKNCENYRVLIYLYNCKF